MKPLTSHLKIVGLLLILFFSACTETKKEPKSSEKEEIQIYLEPLKQKAIYTYKDESGAVFHEEKPTSKYKTGDETIVTPLFLSPEARNSAKKIFLADNTKLLTDKKVLLRQVSRLNFEQNLKIENFKASLDRDLKGIVIYKTNWCGACQQAIDFLESEKLKFKDFDIEADEEAKRRMMAMLSSNGMQFRGVPVIAVNGKAISGFDPDWIKNEINK